MWTKNYLALLARRKSVLVGGASALSFLAGAGSSHFLTRKMLRLHYEEIAEREISEAKRFYTVLQKPSLEETVESKAYERKISELNYVSTHPALEPVLDDGSDESQQLISKGEKLAEVLEESAQEVKNVFDTAAEPVDFDYEYEISRRSREAPYIISYDEFYEGEKEYDQSSLTYYEGDDVLVDERDQPINETHVTVGDDNLMRFGHGSKDKHIVYVRNDNLELDFEIARSNGFYTQEVLGYIQHSDRNRIQKFRRDDE